jgi:hypothetical protein
MNILMHFIEGKELQGGQQGDPLPDSRENIGGKKRAVPACSEGKGIPLKGQKGN